VEPVDPAWKLGTGSERYGPELALKIEDGLIAEPVLAVEP
jgi:hypothetical protein